MQNGCGASVTVFHMDGGGFFYRADFAIPDWLAGGGVECHGPEGKAVTLFDRGGEVDFAITQNG